MRGWHQTTTAGITFGSCLAIVVSYSAWHSIPWAILHGLFSWGYVIYYVLRYLTTF
jgi:hypothetical protein